MPTTWTPLIGPLQGPNIGIPTMLPNLTSPWSVTTGVTASPIINVSPASLTFTGTQPYMVATAPRSVTVTSGGAANLLVSLPSITGANAGDFGVTTNCQINPSPLAPAATCTVSVTFKPTYYGTRTANLVIPSNDPANPFTTIPLTGTGGLVPLTITAPTTTFLWTQSTLPALTVGSVTGLAGTDTLASLNIVCSTTYLVGGLPGTYPTSCLAGTNPNNAYTITYVPGTLTVTPATAMIISPVQGSVLPSSIQTFTWTTVANGWYYQLCIGTSPGYTNLGCSTAGGATSYTATNLPMTGLTIYVRLNTRFLTGVTNYLDYTYTGTSIKAAMLTPTPGSTLSGGTATFTWTAGQGMWYYTVCVGSSLGFTDLGCSSSLGTTTWSIVTLPRKGSTIYVRLNSRFLTSVVQYSDYTYVAGP